MIWYGKLTNVEKFESWCFECQPFVTENELTVTNWQLTIRSDVGPTPEASAFEFLYGGQFTISTHLINSFLANNQTVLVMAMVMVMNLYSAFSIDIQMRFTSKWSMGEIGHQHIQAPLAAAISPLAISPSTWMNEMSPDHNTESSMPYLRPTGLWDGAYGL